MTKFVSFAQHGFIERQDNPKPRHLGVATRDSPVILGFEGTGRASAFFEKRGRVENDRP